MPKFNSEEKAKEFMECQNEYRLLAREYASLQKDTKSKLNENQINRITSKEIETIPSTTEIYKSVGRMFLKSNKSSLQKEIHEKETLIKNEIEKSEKKLSMISKKEEVVEKKMTELVDRYAILA